PPMNIQPFDYESYKKDGEAYLKEWKKDFDKGFGKDYERKMEEWSKQMDLKRAEIEKRRREMEKNREQAQQDRFQRLQEIQNQRMEIHEKGQEKMARSITSGKQLGEMKSDRNAIAIKVDSAKGKSNETMVLDLARQNAPNVFYSIK